MSDNINFDYKNLSPFKWFVLENFPFIEADFDALTEWQLFCKIGKEINKIIDSQNIVGEQAEILTNAFNNLKNYIDNYFNNLDVQEEINNKLNEMAEDGTLTQLIKNYIDPLYQNYENEINNIINTQNNKINSLSNGTPIVVSNTSDMVDTTKIYILVSSGDWYYYNGTQWTIGGQYQGIGINDKSISFVNLDDLLQKNFNIQYGEPLTSPSYAGFCKILNGAFSIDNDPNFQYEIYDLSLGDTLQFNVYNYYNMCGLLIIDSSNNIIYNSNPNATGRDNINVVMKIKQNGLKAYISHRIEYDIPTNNRNIRKIARKIINVSNNLKINTDITLLETYEGYDLRTNTYLVVYTNPDSNVYIYSMEKGKTYKIKAYNQYAVTGYTITGLNNNLIATSYDGSPSSPTLKEIVYTATEDGFIYVADYAGTPSVEIIYNAINMNSDLYNKNPLNNKKVYFFGDSITAGNGSWADVNTIRNENNMSGNNFAVGGMTYTVKDTSNSSNNILLRIKEKIELDNNVDYIILQGGVNDAFQSLSKGTPLANDDFTTQCDTSTFSGAFEDAIRYVLTEVPECKVGFIINAKIPRLPILNQYMEIAKSICEKYSVPTLDFYNESGLCAGISSINNTYFLHTIDPSIGDGTHPTATGYAKYLNNKVESFMKSL